MSGGPRTVEAAGCVVWRRDDDGIAILVVHRPAPHDDWSLPKGKLHAGESHGSAALREVHEETGVRGDLGPKLGEVRYELPSGDHKHVQFWAMHADGEDPWEADDEIDARCWIPVEEAAAELTWSSDLSIVASFLEQLDRLDGDASTAP